MELKILAKLFTPEEANLASTLSLEHQSIKKVAERNNAGESEVKSLSENEWREKREEALNRL